VAAERTSGRLHFPEAEQAQPWLGLLLEAYSVIDEGVRESVARAEHRGGALACARGCASCCRTHTDIPVYPLEMMGLAWYLVERIEEPLRSRLREQLKAHTNLDGCPFLLDEACAIHPLRPAACRQFNVLGRPCGPGEDAYHTRREDVVEPIRRYLDTAFDIMLPFYGVQSKAERRRAIKEGRLHALARSLRTLEWASLVRRMEEYDRRFGAPAEAEER